MAEQIEAFEFRGSGRPAVYPWADWLNGATWRLMAGVDFQITPDSFRRLALGTAARRGHKVSTNVEGDVVVLRAGHAGEDAA